MNRGAQPGNKNAAKKRLPWQQALKRQLTRLAADEGEKKPNYRRGLDRVAKKVVDQAAEGNKDAWMEIANRLEGKPGQSVEISGNPDKPIGILPFEFIDSTDSEEV
jgi:hypothetical protein